MHPRHSLLFAALLLLPACRSGEVDAPPSLASTSSPDAAPSSAPAPPPAAPAPTPPPDPERDAKLDDLDAMCKALNRDYSDGTLGDYYADVKPATAWGKQQRAAGNESIKPGRLLEQAVAELGLTSAETPEHCRKLLDYLDDVE